MRTWRFRKFSAYPYLKKMRRYDLEEIPRVWLDHHSIKRLPMILISQTAEVRNPAGIRLVETLLVWTKRGRDRME